MGKRKKKVLVTGGSRGIGKAIVEKFQQEGYEVDFPNRAELELNSKESVKEFLEKNSSNEYDILVNNAGINEINEIEKISETEIENSLQVNLISPIMLIQGIVPKMKEKKFGRIVNIGSIWGVVSKERRCMYSATKSGLHGVTNSLAVELAEYNILVNTVCPGYTMTELTRKNNTRNEILDIQEKIPMKRLADPNEIAEVVYFLCSDSNTYIVGQKIVVDGGYTVQ